MLKIGVTGHRPDKLGGYDLRNPLRVELRAAFKERLLCLIGAHMLETGDTDAEVFTGMAQGWDQDCAIACVQAGVPFVAVVPFRSQAALWPETAQRDYRAILAKAQRVIIVSECDPTHAEAVRLLHLRNQRLVAESDVIIAGFDGSPGGTAHCVARARREGKPVYVMNPRDYAEVFWQKLREEEAERRAEEQRRKWRRGPSVVIDFPEKL